MNLVETAYYARKMINFLILSTILLVLFFVTKPFVLNAYNSVFPEENPPTIAFGILEPITFIEKEVLGRGINSIELDTPSGQLPMNFPDRMVVIKYDEVRKTFQSGRRVQETGAKLGFTDEELTTNLKGDIFSWKDFETGAELTMNSETFSLDLITNIAAYRDKFAVGKLTKRNAVEDARNTLSALGYLTDIKYRETENIEVRFGKILNAEIVEASSVFDAQFARVDFFRDILGYPVVGPEPKAGLINIYVAQALNVNENSLLNNPIMEIHEWPVIEDTSATYPIIPVQQAWTQVAEGNGVLAEVIPRDKTVLNQYKPTRVEDVFITKIYLAYYDAPEPQKYMQPIYVFEGKYNVDSRAGGEITYYFPAISGQYVAQPENSNTLDITE